MVDIHYLEGGKLKMGWPGEGGTNLCQNPSPLQLTSCFLKISTRLCILNGHYVLLLETHRKIFKIYKFSHFSGRKSGPKWT